MAKKHKNKKHSKFSLTKKLLIIGGGVVLLGGAAAAVAVPLSLAKPKDTGIKINIPAFGKTIQAYCYMGSESGSSIKLSATLSEKNKEKEVIWQKVSGSDKISIDENSGVLSWLPFNKSEGPDIKFKIKASVKDESSISNTQSFTIHLNQSKIAITSTNFGADTTVFSRYAASTDANAIQLEANFAPSEDENLLSSSNSSQEVEWTLSNVEPATVSSKFHVDPNSGLVTWDAVTKDELTNEDHSATFKVNAALKSDTSFSASKQYTIRFGNPVPYDGENSWLDIDANGVLNGPSTKWDNNNLKNYDTLFIPTAVTQINSYCFYNRTDKVGKILKTDAPNGLNLVFGADCQLQNIDSDAFRGCTGLVGTVEFPENHLVSGITMPQRAFMGCTGIKKVDLSKCLALKGLYMDEFSGCTDLKEVVFPKFLDDIGQNAFKGDINLTILNLPNGLSSISSGAFDGCTGVESFDVSHCYKLKSIDKSIIYSFKPACFNVESCDGQNIYYDKSYKYCFGFYLNPKASGDKDVGTARINPQCSCLVDYAFSNDSSSSYAQTFMTTLDISQCNKLKYIGRNSFNDQTKMTGDLVFPDSITNIQPYCFNSCGITSLDFSNCIKVTTMSSNGVSYHPMPNLTTIKFPRSLISGAAQKGCPKLSSVNFSDLTQLESIGMHAFEDDPMLTNIDLSGCTSLTSVAQNAISTSSLTCTSEDNGIYYDASHTVCFGALDSTNVPSGALQINPNTKLIANNAFKQNFTNVTSFSMEGCNDFFASPTIGILSGVTFANPDSALLKDDNGFYYDKGGVVCFGQIYNADVKTVHTDITADELNFLPTTRYIAPFAFRNTGGSVEKINLPPLLNAMGMNAMAAFKALKQTSIVFPDSMKLFDKLSFSSNTQITSVTLPANLQMIDMNAFAKNSGLTSIILPNNVKSIKAGAFDSCTNLQTIIFDNNLTYIGSGAFKNCGLKQDLVFPVSLTTLDKTAFQNCAGIPAIDLSKCNNLYSIGSDAFSGCSSLKDIKLSDSIITFDPSWCGDANQTVDSITLPWTSEQIDAGIDGISQLPDISMSGVVYIKKGMTKEMYLSEFNGIIPSSYKLPSVVWKATL